ncbi:MAG: hypothetical protein DI534_00925 [Leifsonia xyli]|nr:MAG: hypothetical protein DI534_00925 [Leifsonia xyli]
MLELAVPAPVPAVPSTPRRAAGAWWSHPALLLGVAGALIGFAGSWLPSYWGDEAASVLAANRSWPNLLLLIGHVDAVHGVYYAGLHLWTAVFGTSELATRLPSAVGVGFLVAGVVVLARLLGGGRLAWIAGVVAIALPRTMFMAVEARSYALGTAVAVWVTVLLVELLRRERRRMLWLGYAASMAAAMYLFLYLGLLLAVHAGFVLLFHRGRIQVWARSAALAVVLAVPILVMGFLERRQIGFLANRDYAGVSNVLVGQWFGDPVFATLAWALITVALGATVAPLVRRRAAVEPARLRLVALAALWLLLPTALLLLGNAVVAPMYIARYVSFCVPAAAMLIAVGVDLVARFLGRRRLGEPLALGIALATIVAVAAPDYLAQRGEFAKDGGSDWRAVASYLESHAASGDAVVFDQTTKPSRDPRLVADLYPASVARLRDVALVSPAGDGGELWDTVDSNETLGASIVESREVWAVELSVGTTPPSDVTFLERLGYVVADSALIHRTTVFHLVKE